MNYARQKGYQINRNALHLRGTGSNIIGVVVPNIHHNFFSNFVSSIARMAFEFGYIVAVFQSEESVGQEKEVIKSIIQQNVAGVIASLSMETTDVEHFQQLSRYKIPLVCFDRISPKLERPSVVLDNEGALRNVVLMLHAKGFARIAYLSGNPEIHLFRKRQEGYHRGIAEMGGRYQKCIAIPEGFTHEHGFSTTKQLFEGDDRPDALIFDSHILALGGIEYLKAQKGSLLDKIGLASFGGHPWLSFAAPTSISIQQPEGEMARVAFNLLIEAMENPEIVNFKTVMLQSTII